MYGAITVLLVLLFATVSDPVFATEESELVTENVCVWLSDTDVAPLVVSAG